MHKVCAEAWLNLIPDWPRHPASLLPFLAQLLASSQNTHGHLIINLSKTLPGSFTVAFLCTCTPQIIALLSGSPAFWLFSGPCPPPFVEVAVRDLIRELVAKNFLVLFFEGV